MKFEGGLTKQAGRFALLRHEMPESALVDSHWDLMFEAEGGDLLTFRLSSLPAKSGSNTEESSLLACRLPNHRSIYLTYEGAVSGDRGRVFALARGRFSQVETPQDDRVGARAAVCRVVLRCPTGEAEIAWDACEVGEKTHLHIAHWALI